MMKKLQLILSLFVASAGCFAQQNHSEAAPFSFTDAVSVPSDRALWTIQLDSDPKPIAAGLAGVCWIGTEFWVSKWGNDSLFTVNASGVSTGSFVITGVTGTRSITTDGTSIYLGAATSSIFQVNPVTKTLTSTITTSVTACRYLTYDASLNGGAGGFWTGSYASDITAVSMTGATLSVIPAATHTLTSIYGLAHDPYSAGGPYLWAYDQAAPGAVLYQLTMSGTMTGVTHDTELDLAGGAGGGLAGGLFITNSFVTGMKTLGGLNQGVSLFAYELSDPLSVESSEANVFDLSVYPNPSSFSSTVTFDLKSEDVVGIQVYNLLGSLVQNIKSEKMLAGKHTLTIDNTDLNNGSYFVKLTAGSTTAAARFTVMK